MGDNNSSKTIKKQKQKGSDITTKRSRRKTMKLFCGISANSLLLAFAIAAIASSTSSWRSGSTMMVRAEEEETPTQFPTEGGTFPTESPTTPNPTTSPSSTPTRVPTVPTEDPTTSPTSSIPPVTSEPTDFPTEGGTFPTESPTTPKPTTSPSSGPSSDPTAVLSETPSVHSSEAPVQTDEPSVAPTGSASPSGLFKSEHPTFFPTEGGTFPTESPTTPRPTRPATPAPSPQPSVITVSPSLSLSPVPTLGTPTYFPTEGGTFPTESPTTPKPTITPSDHPSGTPSSRPSNPPSVTRIATARIIGIIAPNPPLTASELEAILFDSVTAILSGTFVFSDDRRHLIDDVEQQQQQKNDQSMIFTASTTSSNNEELQLPRFLEGNSNNADCVAFVTTTSADCGEPDVNFNEEQIAAANDQCYFFDIRISSTVDSEDTCDPNGAAMVVDSAIRTNQFEQFIGPVNLVELIPATSEPSSLPSGAPSLSLHPSSIHSNEPSLKPSASPSLEPSDLPSEFPSLLDSNSPSELPSEFPSLLTSSEPSDLPSEPPSDTPTLVMSKEPSNVPHTSDFPSLSSSKIPSELPSMIPSNEFSEFPSQILSEVPSTLLSELPSTEPSELPSTEPSELPSTEPSDLPSDEPSDMPFTLKSEEPSVEPSELPSEEPSEVPSEEPSEVPSEEPSEVPSEEPSEVPSEEPSEVPSEEPSEVPSEEPSEVPSEEPSEVPSEEPSEVPSEEPSEVPSEEPSEVPSEEPSQIPSEEPSELPSEEPSELPSDEPSGQPFLEKSEIPSEEPSELPSEEPSELPSSEPSGLPSLEESEIPSESSHPSGTPSTEPSLVISASPTFKVLDPDGPKARITAIAYSQVMNQNVFNSRMQDIGEAESVALPGSNTTRRLLSASSSPLVRMLFDALPEGAAEECAVVVTSTIFDIDSRRCRTGNPLNESHPDYDICYAFDMSFQSTGNAPSGLLCDVDGSVRNSAEAFENQTYADFVGPIGRVRTFLVETPSSSPSHDPSSLPSQDPTTTPSPTNAPTFTEPPTESSAPSDKPSADPSSSPSSSPSSAPSNSPSSSPSSSPSESPTSPAPTVTPPPDCGPDNPGNFSVAQQGSQNRACCDFCVISGGLLNYCPSTEFAAANSNGRRRLQSSPLGNDWNTIAGGSSNYLDSRYGVIGGGTTNVVEGPSEKAVISGGFQNVILKSNFGVISGGSQNVIANMSDYATISGGIGNNVTEGATFATISGGKENSISGDLTLYSTISGGQRNTILSGKGSTIVGGSDNLIDANNAFAFGRNAEVKHNFAMVMNLGDTPKENKFSSTANGQFAFSGNNFVMVVKAGKGTKKTVNINRSNVQALIDELSAPPSPPTPAPTVTPDTDSPSDFPSLTPSVDPTAACTNDFGFGVKIPVKGYKAERTCTALLNTDGCNSTIKGPSGLKVYEVCRLSCDRCDLQPDPPQPPPSMAPTVEPKICKDEQAAGIRFGPVEGFQTNRTCTAYRNKKACNTPILDGSGKRVYEECRLTCNRCDESCVDEFEFGIRFGPVEGFKTNRTCTAYKNKKGCNDELLDGTGRSVFEVCRATCGRCERVCKDDYGLGVRFGPVEDFKNDRTCAAYKKNRGCNKEIEDGTGRKVFEVCRKSCERCDESTCTDTFGIGIKFGPVEGFKQDRTCAGFKNNGGCDKTIEDGSNRKVFEVCRNTCDSCVGECSDKYKSGVLFGPVQGFKKDRTCTAYKNNGGCDSDINDGSGQKVFEVCRSTCNKCESNPLCQDKYGIGSKFGPVEGFKVDRSCTAYKNNKACDKNLEDGSNQKVFEVCRKTCDACVEPEPNPTSCEDEFSTGVRFGPVEGFQQDRTCTAYSNKDACDSDFLDGSNRKVFEVCRKTCDACVEPEPNPLCVDDFVAGVRFGPVEGFNVNRSCRAYSNNDACDNLLKSVPGRKVSDVCRATCNKCDSQP